MQGDLYKAEVAEETFTSYLQQVRNDCTLWLCSRSWFDVREVVRLAAPRRGVYDVVPRR
jgi:hypothetical protein